MVKNMNTKQTPSVKRVVLVISTSILVALLVCSLIGSAGYIGDSNTVMRLGKFSITPYSYVVEPFNSTHYQSINASGYVSQSTSASAVINNAIGNMTQGDLLLKTGTYELSDEIKAVGHNDFAILGEQGTILKRSDNTNYSVFHNFQYFYPMVIIENCSNFRIANIVFDGNGANNLNQDTNPNGDGGNVNLHVEGCSSGVIDNIQSNDALGDPVHLVNCEYISMIDCNFTNTAYVASPYCFAIGGSQHINIERMYIKGYAKALELFPPYTNIAENNLYHNQYLSFNHFTYIKNWIVVPSRYAMSTNQSMYIWEANHCTFTDCNFLTEESGVGNGIFFDSGYYCSDDITFRRCIIDSDSYSTISLTNVTNMKFLDCTFLRGNYGLWMRGSNNTQIVGCLFNGTLNSVGQQLAVLADDSGGMSYNTYVERCTFEETTVVVGQVVVFGSAADNITFTHNTFKGSPTLLFGSPANTGIHCSNNIGFVTENSGSSDNATATTFTIAHGLAGTPTNVQLSFNTIAVSSYTWTADATNIYVTAVCNNQIFVPFNSNITHLLMPALEWTWYYINLTSALSENRNIVAVAVWADRTNGSSSFLTYPNDGTWNTHVDITFQSQMKFIIVAQSTNRLKYVVVGTDTAWTVYCSGYVVDVGALPSAYNCYWSAVYVP